MKIAVCVKEVPDTTAEKRIDPSTFRLVRTEGDRMLNEFDKYAVEEAIRLKEAGTADEVILVSLGPEKAVESLRQALAMGADRLVLVSDPAAAGSDYLGTARALAKAIDETGAELVLLGAEATDARSGVLTATLGEVSGRTWVTSANSIAVNGSSITIERQSDDGVDTVEAPLPAVVSVTKAINEPRYPSLKAIMGAKKKQLDTVSAADVAIDASKVGGDHSAAQWTGSKEPPKKAPGRIIEDEDTAQTVEQIVAWLDERKLI